ncbi:hypothetical protein [Caldalkalibacillus mannanilyticus]|uniref:hypothetical protein n=1 Tax=Caldalkalibacillus mannanilyticus TaxID=1418 RepID=UPI00046811F1|nr:hypothetical protein [Caldalkalibacillus mannanilyticus]
MNMDILFFSSIIIIAGIIYLFIKPRKVKYRFAEADTRPLHEQWFSKFSLIFHRFSKVSQEQQEELERCFRRLGMKTTVQQFQTERITFVVLMILIFLTLALFSQNFFWVIVAVVAGGFMYFQPILSLQTKITKKENVIREELPDFIDLLILLMNAGLTPNQALKQAVEFNNSEALREDFSVLSVDIETIGEYAAFEEFADRVNISEIKQFSQAFKQAMDVDKEKGKEILASQSEVMRELRMQHLRQTLKQRPMRVQMINMGMFLFILMIPMGIVFLSFMKIMTNFE